MTAKIPTQRNVSAVLAKQFTKSVRSKSRIKGLPNYSDGYTVQGAFEGVVWVRHEAFSTKRIAAMLGEYMKAVEEAGFAVERRHDRLIVRTMED